MHPEEENVEMTPPSQVQEEKVQEEAKDEVTEEIIEVTAEVTDEVTAEDLLPEEEVVEAPAITMEDAKLKAVLEAIIYVTDEPLSLEQICIAVDQPRDRVIDLLEQLAADYEKPDRGLSIREVAGGFKMATKPEHHEEVRQFVKNLNPPLKLSLPALETLAVIAYKQPITAPEIMEIRGVQGAGVLTTLIARKLIAAAGRKQVIGKPILYKTTREFLVQFGLKDLAELPSLKEFQELGRQALESEQEPVIEAPVAETPEPEVEAAAPESITEPVTESTTEQQAE
jgi:segregation and condensation protein B